MIGNIIRKLAGVFSAALSAEDIEAMAAWFDNTEAALNSLFENGRERINTLSQISQAAGDITSGRFIAPSASATDTEPSSTGFTGSFMSGDGETFSNVAGQTFNAGSVAAGLLQVGYNTNGDLVWGAGAAAADASGLVFGLVDTGGTTHPTDPYHVKWSSVNGASFLTGWAADYGAIVSTYIKIATDAANSGSEVALRLSSDDNAADNGNFLMSIGSLSSFSGNEVETVFNEDSNDIDFRVEGATNANLLTADAGLDAIGIGGAAESGYVNKVTGNEKITGNLEVGGTLTLTGVNVGKWNQVKKTANETIQSDNTLNIDSALAFSLAASTNYAIRGRIFFQTTAAADFKYRFNKTNAITLFSGLIAHIVPGTTAKVPLVESAFPTTTVSVVGAGTIDGYIEFDMIIQNDAAGTFSFQWCQDTSTAANTTVLAGSYFEYMTI